MLSAKRVDGRSSVKAWHGRPNATALGTMAGRWRVHRGLVVTVLLLMGLTGGMAGCSSPNAMVASPNLFTDSLDDPFAEVPVALQTNTANVLFATNREREVAADGTSRYTARRSRSMSVGLATVTMGENLSWEELATASRTRPRAGRVRMAVTAVGQCGEFPMRPPAINVDGHWVDPPEYLDAVKQATADVHRVLAEQLALTPRKEVYVFVHGFNNSFDQGCYRAAQIWHFTGRGGVPVMFSWPAGSPGLLRGYTRDRESGDFSTPHLRVFLRALASCPEVEKVHLIAHSRGTGILGTAIRELHLEYAAAGRDTRESLKLGQVVLAAPDIDFDVFLERMSADRVTFAAERLTIYISPNDRAIGLASWLFGSFRRLGQLLVGDLSSDMAEAATDHPVLNVVDVRARTGRVGHDYFLTSPAVLSDLILVLRDHRPPGAKHGRPLENRGFWTLNDGYPFLNKEVPPAPVVDDAQDDAHEGETSPDSTPAAATDSLP